LDRTEARNQLFRIQQSLLLSQDLEFYTDGLLVDLGLESAIMGLAFIQTHSNSPQHQFMVTVESFPSACHAELTAIITSLLVSPPNSFVTVYTDSLSTIKHYEQTVDSLLSTFPQNILKESNNLLWSILRSIIYINNIHVPFMNLIADSSNILNHGVD